MDGHIGDEITA